MILPIVQAGDPVLRVPARPLSLDEIQSPTIQQLIADMRETMRAAPGVGLAAPQIGLPLQLAVIEDAPEYQANATPAELAERERAVVPFQVIINPALTLVPGTAVEFFEGCLSVDGWMALVPRAAAVRVEALDEQGRDVRIEARGLARAHPAARDRSPARHACASTGWIRARCRATPTTRSCGAACRWPRSAPRCKRRDDSAPKKT